MLTLRKFNKFLMLSTIFILSAWMWQMAIQSILLITSEKFEVDSHNTPSSLEMSSQECFFYFYGLSSEEFFEKIKKVKWSKN